MQNLVEITQLEKKVDDFHLGPIDLKIEPGTITTLVGNNGSGKSTLLKLIMNLAKPDSGSIKLFDKFVYGEDESWKVNVAYQPQTTIGYSAFTGEDLKSLISHWYPSWDDASFNSIVKLLDIPLTKRFSKLSQGAQQKLTLALTIPRNAPLLILDEPTSFMDIPSKKILIDLLVDWMDNGERSILIASHQAEDIKKLSDYLCVLRSGKMVGTFEKEQLTESHRRYWIDKFPQETISGEVLREDHGIISNRPEETEAFLKANNIPWSTSTAVELEDIITLLLANKEG